MTATEPSSPTAGPWEWHGDPADQSAPAVQIAPEGERRRAYFELVGRGRWVLSASVVGPETLPVILCGEADANLIAAAPALLEAAQEVLQTLLPDYPDTAYLCDVLGGAISRATGRQP